MTPRGSTHNAPLPIDEAADELAARLRSAPNLVLVAPPGSGKTTRVPQILLDRGVIEAGSCVLVLEPRRLAARLAAERIAFERGSSMGGEVGYQIRFENRTSKETRIAFLTEGILVRRIQSDPYLEGVGAVILDEFHERSVHADLSIAFLKEVQETVRPDLRIVVMSATLDSGPITAFLPNCGALKSEGRMFPVEVVRLDRPDDRPLPELVSSAVRRALNEADEGDILVFLPGAPEIRDVISRLEGLDGLDSRPDSRSETTAKRLEILPLYGELAAQDQDRAVRPAAHRKIIVSTNIAESSLTIPGVRIVIDSGYANVLRYDPALGLDRLERVRISKQNAAQRAGRAGRTGPGRAYQLWTDKEEQFLPVREEPEIRRIDLAPVFLEVVRWSPQDPKTFAWFEAPPAPVLARAETLLRALGALDEGTFQLTDLGRRIAEFPLHPRLAALLLAAQRMGRLARGALLAAIASEREVFVDATMSEVVASSDLLVRAEKLEAFEAGLKGAGLKGAGRAHSRSLAEDFGIRARMAENLLRVRDRLLSAARQRSGRRDEKGLGDQTSVEADEERDLRAILAAYPDRVGRRLADHEDQGRVRLVEGREGRLGKASVVKDAEFLVAVNVEAKDRRPGAPPGLIRWASQIEKAWLKTDKKVVARWNRQREVVEAIEEARYLDLMVEERPITPPPGLDLSEVLSENARKDLERALPLTESFSVFLHRCAFLARACPELDMASMGPDFRLKILDELCLGKRSFRELQALRLEEECWNRLSPAVRQALKVHAPESIAIPSGRAAPLRYEADGPPVLSVRLQEMFGLYETPRVAMNRVPIRIELLSPSARPVQVTQDLASFWRTTYPEVRKELRRRYPKHQWPEDPKDGIPSARVRPRREG